MRSVAGRPLTFTFIPDVSVLADNPYWPLLREALEAQGAQYVAAGDPRYLQWRWLVRNRGKVDVLHLHFLRHHYAKDDERASLRQLAKFVGKLALARLLGYRVVWTMHNLRPHEPLRPEWVGELAQRAVAHLSNAVIVHCEHARDALAQRYGRVSDVFVCPMGNYFRAHPGGVTRPAARSKLRVREGDSVFVFLGLIRRYKGIESLIDAFGRLPRCDVSLLIAGRPVDEAIEDELRNLAQGDARVKLCFGHIPDSDMQLYLAAADAVVLPFSGVLTSSSAVLAMSFGRPVVGPAIGCLPETVVEGTGVLYDPTDPDGLRDALAQCLSLDLEAMGRRAYEAAAQWSWERVAKGTTVAYGLLERDPRAGTGFAVETRRRAWPPR